jgi:hypothetical protein
MTTYFSAQCEVLAYVLSMAFAIEGVMYLVVYRTERWQRLKSKVVKLHREVTKKTGEDGSLGKKVKVLAKDLKGASVALYQMKYRCNFGVCAAYGILIWMLSVKYDGQAVAVLPFTPLRFLQRITARGLDGRPQNECCLHFFYILCSMALKDTVHKALGFGIPRGIPNPVYEASMEMSKRYEQKWTAQLENMAGTGAGAAAATASS